MEIKAKGKLMSNGNIEHICRFLASRPRYKLVVCRENPCADITPLNLGYAISTKVACLQDRTTLSYIAPSIVDEVINGAVTHVEDLGDVVVIENLGILFEPELGLIPSDIIMKHAKNKTFVLIWNGIYYNQALLYATDSICIIDISNINRIAL